MPAAKDKRGERVMQIVSGASSHSCFVARAAIFMQAVALAKLSKRESDLGKLSELRQTHVGREYAIISVQQKQKRVQLMQVHRSTRASATVSTHALRVQLKYEQGTLRAAAKSAALKQCGPFSKPSKVARPSPGQSVPATT